MHSYYNNNRLAAAIVAGILATGSGSALALEKGDWIARVGASHVSPNDDSSTIEPTFGAGSGVTVDTATQLSFTVGYMVTDSLAVEVLGALPFTHAIEGKGTLSSLGEIAETKHLPPVVSLQYHVNPKGSIRPYVGVGLNYTIFFDEETKGALKGTDISLDNSFGLAGQVGVDFDLNKSWFLNADMRYIQIDTEASLGTGAGDKVSVDINPWVFTMAIGTTF